MLVHPVGSVQDGEKKKQIDKARGCIESVTEH